jgi:hemerythrin
MSQNKGEMLLEGAKIMKELFLAKPEEHFGEETQFMEVLEFFEKLFTSPP